MMRQLISRLVSKAKGSATALASTASDGRWFNAVLCQVLSFVFCGLLGVTAAQAQFLDDGFGGLDLEWPPIAIAGEDQAVRVGDTVRLDGSASNDDADAGTIEAYDWSLKTIRANNDRAAFIPEVRAYFRSLVLTGRDTSTPTLVVPMLPSGVFEVDLIVELTVTDGDGKTSWATDASQVMITVLGEVPSAPGNIIASARAGNIDVTFDVADSGGTPVTDIQYRLNGGAWQSTGSADYAFTLSGLDATLSHALEVRAENAAGISLASPAETLTLPNPLAAFGEAQPAYVAALRNHAVRSLRGEQVSARRVVQSARDRLAVSLSGESGTENVTRLYTGNGVGGVGDDGGVPSAPFAVGETFVSLSVEGAASGSGARTVNSSLVREFSPSPETRWGLMLRAAQSDEDAAGVFTGNIITRSGSVGLYGVTALGEGLYIDTFVMGGRSRQSVALRTGSISITSDYWVSNSLAGMSLSGTHSVGQYTWVPSLSATVARGEIGVIDSDVRGFDLLAEGIATDLGSVRYSEFTVSPEVRYNFPLDQAGYIAFVPRWSCADSDTAALDNGCSASAELKLQLENGTPPGHTLTLSAVRDDLRRGGRPRIAAQFSVRF